MATLHRSQGRTGLSQWVREGLYGGVIAGLVFAMFEMIASAAMNGLDAVFMPLRMIGGIVFGAAALEPSFPLFTAASVGVLVHLVLSAVFGVGISAVLGSVPLVRRSPNWVIGLATFAGYLLWLVNFFVIAYLLGWVWFPERTDPMVQFLAHTVAFGTVLGGYLNMRLLRTSRSSG